MEKYISLNKPPINSFPNLSFIYFLLKKSSINPPNLMNPVANNNMTTSSQKPLSTLPTNQFIPEQHLKDLFIDVQLNALFPDSKTFADAILLDTPESILEKYHQEKSQQDFDLKKFILTHFQLPSDPAKGFQADTSLSVSEHIKRLWPVLTRQPVSERSSLIPVPFPSVVPGDRFGETYYWDTYFTMLGLQESKEIGLLQNIVDNFAHLIETIGHIPNGCRSYYLSRSQPPFFALMVDILAQEKGKEVWKQYRSVLKKEYEFWMDGAESLKEAGKGHRRVVRLEDGSLLNRYWDDNDTPRPESYKEDVHIAKESGRNAHEICRDLRAAAESGWDFSHRWFADKKTLHTIRTTQLIPVDLNALIYYMETSLANAAEIEGDSQEAEGFRAKAETRRKAVLKYCWSHQEKFFYDYDFVKGELSDIPTLAASYPLYFKMADAEQAKGVAQKLEKDFLKFGGLVTSLVESGQQWDSPNGWAPLQWMSIQGLMNYGEDELAEEVGKRWIKLGVDVFKRTGKMVEKYDVVNSGLEAGGGEYPNQDGFGWTNGVMLKLLSFDRFRNLA